MQQANYKLLKDGSYFGEISGLDGVWADSGTLEDCRMELQEVLEDWLFLKIRDKEKIPGMRVSVDKRELVNHA